ncbi:MAG: hypothetical protein J0G96_09940 [Flavobacteriia bacterium]|nr:hypothetical protein [Flavobacteriia bacterium]
MKLRILLVLILLINSKIIMAQQSVQQNISVLFIGNSYTFMNNMPFIFQEMAKAEGVNAYVDTVVEGGKNLLYHSTNPETYEKIRSRNWTYVVIQGHSNEFATPKTEIEQKSEVYLSRIIDSIRTNNTCTKVILYMTWAYKNGNKNWEPINSYEKMQKMVIDNYIWMAKDFNTILSPVGKVWQSFRQKYPDENLYFEDERHPNLNGSYLSATTFFTTITRKSPIGIPVKINIDPVIKQHIETQVFNLVSSKFPEWRNYPEEYPIEPGFDVVVVNKKGRIYNNSKDGIEVRYKINGSESIDEQEPEFTVPNRTNELIIEQTVGGVCRSVSLTRKIEL